MNQYTGVPAINPETVIQVLAEVYPKTLSMTSLQGKLHSGRPRIESALMTLVAQGRVAAATFNTVATVYRLSQDEAEQHGFKRENPVRNTMEPVYSRPTFRPPSMSPVRPDAEQAMQIMSRRGDSFVPFMPPMGIASSVRGGA
jgi:hypothetical protein